MTARKRLVLLVLIMATVAALGFGLVARMDLAEIQRPFLVAALFASAISAMLVALGTLVCFRFVNPLVDQLETQTRELRQEVDERIQAEVALRASETRYRSLFDQARDHILLLELYPDEPPIIRDANQAALAAHGYTRGDVVGKPISFLEPNDAPDLFRERQHLLEVTGDAAFEVQHRRKDGSVFVSEVSAREITVGEQRMALCIERDLTERIRAEEALQRSHQELQNLTARLQSIREEERTNLSRELHDNLGQLLTAIRLGLAWLERHVPEEENDLKQQTIVPRVREVGRLIDEATGVTKKVCKELRPTGIDEMGLWPALEAEAAQFTERTGIECTVRSCGALRCSMTRAPAISLFRIVQEALTNVARHAGATAVEIACTPVEDLHMLSVVDNGQGIDPAHETSPDSLGLIGMRERARSIGGRFAISAAAGHGTVVLISTPLDAPRGIS